MTNNETIVQEGLVTIEAAMEFLVAVLHRCESQRLVLFVQPCHGFTLRQPATKMVPSDPIPSLAPSLRLASSVAVQERCQMPRYARRCFFWKKRVLTGEGLFASLPSGAGISKRLFALP